MLTHSSTGHLAYFHVLVTMNNKHRCTKISKRHCLQFGYMHSSRIAGSYSNSILIFEEIPYCFPVVVSFYVPANSE